MTNQERNIQSPLTAAVLYHPSWSIPGGDCTEIGINIPVPSKIIPHSELQYGENIFFQWCYNAKNIRETEKTLNNYNSRNHLFFKFNLILSKIEFLKLTNEIGDYNSYENSCMGSVSSVLKSSTRISIPYPINQLPTLSAAYLTSKYILGKLKIIKPQVESIECNFTSSWRTVRRIALFASAETAAIPLMIARRGILGGISAIRKGFSCIRKTAQLVRNMGIAKKSNIEQPA